MSATQSINSQTEAGLSSRNRSDGAEKSSPGESATPQSALTDAQLRIVLAPCVSGIWPMERAIRICRLYEAGTSLSDIAAAFGVKKNAVVGKVHRFVATGILVARGNAGGNPAYKKPPAAPAPKLTLPPLASHEPEARPETPPEVAGATALVKVHNRGPRTAATRVRVTAEHHSAPRLIPAALNRPLASAPREPAHVAPPPPKYGRVTECCWPLGHPGTPKFRFCDQPSDPGRPYCHPHASKAYVTVRGDAAPQAGTGAILFERAGS